MQGLAQLPFWFTSLFIFLLGLAVGSFVNVIIYRVPRQMSIARPRSHCPACSAPLMVRDNIPLLSYIILKGMCRSCGDSISSRYPIVELLLGILFWFIWTKDGLSWALPLDWAFVSVMVALAGTDLERRLLPDMITYPGFVVAVGVRGFVLNDSTSFWLLPTGTSLALVGAGLIGITGLFMLGIEWLDFHVIGRNIDEEEEQEPEDPIAAPASYGKYLNICAVSLGFVLAGLFLVQAFIRPAETGVMMAQVGSISGALEGALAWAGMLWVLRLVYFGIKKVEGAGFGDVKMMLIVGAYLGLSHSLAAFLLASVLGSVVGLGIMVWRRDRNIQLPYGVFIAMAAIAVLIQGELSVKWFGRLP